MVPRAEENGEPTALSLPGPVHVWSTRHRNRAVRSSLQRCIVRRAEMPKAPVPAAKALDEAGLGFEDLDAVTTHNPFAVNDLWPDPTEPAG
jgi:hypothetical protein